jgi:hypothetical protein
VYVLYVNVFTSFTKFASLEFQICCQFVCLFVCFVFVAFVVCYLLYWSDVYVHSMPGMESVLSGEPNAKSLFLEHSLMYVCTCNMCPGQ